MEKFKLNLEYLYNVIELEFEKLQNETSAEMQLFGKEFIGEHFIVIKEFPKSLKVCSFFLSGSTAQGYVYKCIYNDYA